MCGGGSRTCVVRGAAVRRHGKGGVDIRTGVASGERRCLLGLPETLHALLSELVLNGGKQCRPVVCKSQGPGEQLATRNPLEENLASTIFLHEFEGCIPCRMLGKMGSMLLSAICPDG